MILGHCNTVQKVLTIFGLIAKTACQGSLVKLRYCEKAAEFEKKSPTFFDVYLVTSKQVGDFFKFVWPF